ncbi:MAG TPA: HEAT repeat domain-containing protein [Geothrix sp.]|nr:HEAT repeat domain-containing protein [Geothrix sp.]
MSLAALLFLLVVAGGIYQYGLDRKNQHRIACYRAWENLLADYLFGGGWEHGPFPPIPRKDLWLFRRFLSRYQATLAGQEASLLRKIYRELGVSDSLPARLNQRPERVRAEAALEIMVFQVNEYLDNLLPVLKDPHPYIAQLAAQALAHSQDLRYAEPVVAWVRSQDRYQQERVLRLLEGFGPALLPWLEHHLPPPAENPGPWVIFAQLAASHRHANSQSRLLSLLNEPDVDLLASALKALAALGDPHTLEAIRPFIRNEAWPLRAQAARTLGHLGGPATIADLLTLTSDSVYEVRRNAAQALADLGHAGRSALEWLVEDPEADRFARDIARERLEWSDERGHL